MLRKTLVFFLLLSTFLSSFSYAVNLKFSGFATLGFVQSDQDRIYDIGISKDYNLKALSIGGFQGNALLADNWSVLFQLTAEGEVNFEPDLERASLIWEPNDHWSFQLGRQRSPFWLISEYLQVNALVPWVQPPVEIYSLNPIDTYKGISAAYSHPCGKNFECRFEINFGEDSNTQEAETNSELTVNVNDRAGLTMSMLSDEFHFRLTYSRANVKNEYVTTLRGLVPGLPNANTFAVIEQELKLSHFYSAGFSFQNERYLAYSEFGQIEAEQGNDRIWGSYLTLGYYLDPSKWLLHTTYSHGEADANIIRGQQNTYAGAINYYFNDYTVFKLGYRYVETKNGSMWFNPSAADIAAVLADPTGQTSVSRENIDAHIVNAVISTMF